MLLTLREKKGYIVGTRNTYKCNENVTNDINNERTLFFGIQAQASKQLLFPCLLIWCWFVVFVHITGKRNVLLVIRSNNMLKY